MSSLLRLVLCVGILSVAPASGSPDTPAPVEGRIHYAADGTPAEGLQVVLFDLEDLSRVFGATTDSEGFLRIPLSPAAEPPRQRVDPVLPPSFLLQQNYPNPFNPSTVISYQLARPAHVRLEVYNLLGQPIRTLVDEVREAGDHQTLWHARDDRGRGVAAGVYIYRIVADGVSESRSMVLVDGPGVAGPAAGSASGLGSAGASRASASRRPAPSPTRPEQAVRGPSEAPLLNGPVAPSPYGSVAPLGESFGEEPFGGSAPVLRESSGEVMLAYPGAAAGSGISTAGRAPSPTLAPGAYGLTVSGPGVVIHVEPELRIHADTAPLWIEVQRAADAASAKVTATPRLGDVNNDGAVDIVDALIIATYGVNPEIIVPNHGDMALGDVNADDRVNILDALIVASNGVHPYNPALPRTVGVKAGTVVSGARLDRNGIQHLNIMPGDTVALAAASHPAASFPVFNWGCDTPSIVDVQTDADDASVAYAIALGDSGETALVTVEDRANQYEQAFPVHVGPAPLEVQLPGGATMEFVWLPAGTFVMGVPFNDIGRDSPEHEVTISQSFYLGKYEITQEQWVSVMETTPWSGQDHAEPDPNHPAVYISWHDTQEFIERLNQEAGDVSYRLPTEAEWEYACRAGTLTPWSFGDDEGQLEKYAWYKHDPRDERVQSCRPVGTKLPNPWGLFDMHGNASEWCQDWWDRYTSDDQTDPTGPTWGVERVLRSGSINVHARWLRSETRFDWGPSGSGYDLGARLVRTH